MGYSQDYLDSQSLTWCFNLEASDRETIADCSTSVQQIDESTSGKSAEIDINCQAALSLDSSEQLDTEDGGSNEVIDDVDVNDNDTEVLSDWIIDELENLCDNILDSSGSQDDAYEAAVLQHQSTEGNDVDFLRELPEGALQELFDYYYYGNEDSYSTTTTTCTTTNSVVTEREEAMTEYTGFSF